MLQVVLKVADLEKSLAYYTEKMGFRAGSALPGPDGKPVFSDMFWNDSQILLQLVKDIRPQSPNLELYITLPDNADIDGLYKTMCARGVERYLEIKDEFWGERCFGVTDMDGFQWRFAKTVRKVSMEEMARESAKGQG